MVRARLCCLIALASTALAEQAGKAPADWRLTGDRISEYTATVDRSVASSGAASVLLASKSSFVDGYGGLIQATAATNYRGKRVRCSAALGMQKDQEGAGVWFRADSATGDVLAFDNAQARKGSAGDDGKWKRYSIVIDVPVDAANIFYGITLNGAGKVWADAMKIEVVDVSVPTTSGPLTMHGSNPPLVQAPPPTPRNLDFEQ